MARPYIPPSDKNASLMSPMSAGSNTPISYRANVNRQKTKKWTEAKKIDYGGDDWGGDDDYDLYDAYGNQLEPEPAPASASRPTGLRQPGQGLASPTGVLQDRGQKRYGDIQSASVGRALNRRNSFDADDETRNFSNATIRQGPVAPITSPPQPADPSTTPATPFSQGGAGDGRNPRNPSGPPSLHILTQQPSPTGLRKPVSASTAPPEASDNNEPLPSRTRTNTIDSSILSAVSLNTLSDYEASRDYSPSAVPAPLTMRPLPAPQSAPSEVPTNRFPARKSSLRTRGTEAQRIHQRSQETLAKSLLISSGRSASLGAAAQSTGTPGASDAQPLPFIRPADIYRRVEEEKHERGRSPLDSARPSMDSIVLESSSDRSNSPGQGVIHERSSSDSFGPGNQGRYSFGEEGSESGRRLMPILEPVEERKSEYGFDGLDASEMPSSGKEMSNPPAETNVGSPQLPDLHRISVFGADLFFTQPKLDGAAPPTETITEQPEPKSPEDLNQSDDTSLRSQPSLGFRSVVNQAFDSTGDNSVPPTPASKAESDVKRSDSESTGTSGISPIMSRGSSTTVADNRNREVSTPAIMELVEPSSPPSPNVKHESAEETLPPNFIPGHRRDISTPSPGNSPARTPDLGDASKRISMGEQARISSASPDDPTQDESDQADDESARPVLGREVSFRPQLPGGWQSYTTTATMSTVQPESVRAPSPQMSGDPIQDIAAVDLAPTTTKHSLPASSLDAARVTLGVESDSMPTPDPNGNVHSAMIPHPELVPTLEEASPEIESRSDVAVESIPTESPAPLPAKYAWPFNDEVISEKPPNPILDLQQTDEHLPPSPPPVLPTIDAGSLVEESEKLRKEIIRSLSPRPSEAELANHHLRERLDSHNADQPRESAYLTDVYDDYWDDTVDEEQSSPIATTSSLAMAPVEQALPADMPEIRPLSSHRISKKQTRPALPTRFSWERSKEGMEPPDIDPPEPPRSHVEIPIENIDAPDADIQQIDPEPYMEKEVLQEPLQGGHHPERDAALGTSVAILEGGAAATTLQTSHIESPPTVNVSLARENDQPQSASHPITPAHENEQPALGSARDLPIDPLGSNPHSPANIPSPFLAREAVPSRLGPANPPRTSNLDKILTFKEIAAMKNVHERVKAFDETRERFAAMDSGLHEWILALKAEQPEHDDVTESYRAFRSSAPTGSTRRNTKSGLGVLHSPYHQHTTSPSQSSTPASRPGQNGSSGIQQGFTPAHAKITTQQVQAKGKEFLHTAGIFGGKAGKAGFQAGKGLLAKGKNRLRAAGSSDKTSPPPPTPRNPNRSSWSLALNLSRATGRTDHSRDAEQNIPPGPASRSRMSIPSDVLTSAGIIDIPSSYDDAQVIHAGELNVLSREAAGEILAPDGTDKQNLVNPPEPAEGLSADDEQTDQYLIGADSTTNKPSLLAEQPRSMRPNSAEVASHDAPEEQLGPRDSVVASPVTQEDMMQPNAGLESLTRYPISMMNRPRGVSLDQAALPGQLSRPAIRSIQTPLSTQPTNQKVVAIEEPGRQPSFKALPPIRRTSKFGFEFGSRKPQTRFPISDDEDEGDSDAGTQDVNTFNALVTSSEGSASQQNPHTEVPIADTARDPKLDVQPSTQPRFSVFPRVSDPFGHTNQASDRWRSNPVVTHIRQNSWNNPPKKARSRRGSASDEHFAPRRDSNAAPPLIPSFPFESPPSSAQRYPELFGGLAADTGEDHKMSGGHYQAPVGRTEAFIPHRETSELPGVSPPQDSQEPTGHRRRRSSDIVNRGMDFVRSLSRERRGSVSRGEPISPIDTSATPPSRDDRQNKRGSGFWGNFDITGGQPSSSPVGRESMVAHHSGSQSNLMQSPHDSPSSPGSFPNPNSTLEAPRSDVLERSTTTMGKGFQRDDRKSRLAGLSGIFSRSPKGDGSVLFKPKRATTDLSSFGPRSGTLSSPQYKAQAQQKVNVDHKRRSSQPLNFLSKLAPSTSLHKTEDPTQDSKPHLEPRPRRPSVSGLLTGILRKRANTLDKDGERNEDGSTRPMIVPVARMYSDLPSESQEFLPDLVATPTQRFKKPGQERRKTRSSSKLNGSKKKQLHPHHHSRRLGTPPPRVPEPQYDSVPVPGGYNLVRGDGTTATPTNYDPRGINNPGLPSQRDALFNSLQQSSVPSPVSPPVHPDFSSLHPSSSFHQTLQPERKHPNLPFIDTHSSPFSSPVHTHYPSHDDIIARSPAREQPGQQRPFQLTLPHGSSPNSRSSCSSTPPIPPPKDEPVRARSPSSVPLPADESSQRNENIDIGRFPLPPSPPQHSPEWYQNQNLSVAPNDGLQRSGTGRSLVSAVSQISDSSSPQPPTDYVMEDVLHLDCEDRVKGDGANLQVVSPGLLREQTRYAERQGGEEMQNHAGMGAGDADDGETREINPNQGGDEETEILKEDSNQGGGEETEIPKEDRLHMSATSYPGMEWNPYAGGYAGDE
ncbi:hypothetical protein DSL72_001716 [Monilinia vaccinii-corymbosi]|uniref:SWI-SNF chromatin-remodeling complex protein n=1 Tax=Monilinia vaccinii-corymbosi TaxID=61207 RepID=A0A8A3P7T2_9HELO|nr:hypothetical protein DSL72_001716 [Monilinia vaccinii-corymbosi]